MRLIPVPTLVDRLDLTGILEDRIFAPVHHKGGSNAVQLRCLCFLADEVVRLVELDVVQLLAPDF